MTEIIAEAGLSHCGNLYAAYHLVDEAARAGADVVKFQTYDPDTLLAPGHPDRDLLTKLALSRGQFIALARRCHEVGVDFMSTPGDVDSLKFLVEECGVQVIKIGSDDLTYHPLLHAAHETGLPVYLSTGMATPEEITRSLGIFNYGHIACRVSLMHCVSLYPCTLELANVSAISDMRRLWPSCPIGYSDHTLGSAACLAAAALGANMIEKHISCMVGGPDDRLSQTPDEFMRTVIAIRQVERSLGSGVKMPCKEELANVTHFRKRGDGRRHAA